MGRILKGLAAAVFVTALVLGMVFVAVQAKQAGPGQADQFVVHAGTYISQQAPAQHASLWTNTVFHYALGGVALSTFLVTLLGLYKPAFRVGKGGLVLAGYTFFGGLSLLGGVVLGGLSMLITPLIPVWMNWEAKGWKSGVLTIAAGMVGLLGTIGAAAVSIVHFLPLRGSELASLQSLPHWPFIAWASVAGGTALVAWACTSGIVGIVKGILTAAVAIPYGLFWAVVCALFPPAVAIPGRNDDKKHGKFWNALQGTAAVLGAIAIIAAVIVALVHGVGYFKGDSTLVANLEKLPGDQYALFAWAGLAVLGCLYLLGSSRRKEAPVESGAAMPAAPEPVAAPVAMTAARRFDSEWSLMNELTTAGTEYSEEELQGMLADCQRNGWSKAERLVENRLQYRTT